MSTINLSALRPDFESLRAALAADLATRDAWKGLVATQTGTTLVDFIAAVGAFAQARVLRAQQDAYAETAVSSRALYAIAYMQGLRLARKQPAAATVSITYTQPAGGASTVTIPRYTQLQAAGTYWFLWEAIQVPAGATVEATAYQGYIVDQTSNGLGTDYQSFESVERDFTVSNAHLAVTVNNSPVPVLTNAGLWNKKNSPGVIDRTTPEGRLQLLFGNASYGTSPGNTDTVRIVYAVTSGSDGNNVSVSGQTLTPLNNVLPGVKYVAASQASGGADQTPANTFKVLSSTNMGTMGTAVTKNQYLTLALQYPGVLDAKFFAQRERDPTNSAMMNVIQVSVLTTSPWSSTNRTEFLRYMQERSLYTVQLEWKAAVACPRSVAATVYCYNWASLSQCQADAQAAVSALFAVRAGYLGYDITVSDVYAAILKSNPGIEYAVVASPTADFLASGSPPAAPALSLVAGGTSTLVPDTSYTYALGTIDGYGVRIPAAADSVQTTLGHTRVQISWQPIQDVTSYLVYGRSGSSMRLLATLPASATSFIDDGSVTNGAPMPRLSTYPVLYNTLGSCTIAAAYSARTTAY